MPFICGYQIGLDRTQVSEDTRILYVTTGVLLQKLVAADADESLLKQYTHIILDEVHERDVDTDFVLLVTKIKSCQSRLKPKVVIMSATIESDKFREYFSQSVARPETSSLLPRSNNRKQTLLAPKVKQKFIVF
jgi:ATP-dependent RNA helicase TDRD9